ncbi:MAG: AEC family transporter, partial [Peptococcaceae bacterium]
MEQLLIKSAGFLLLIVLGFAGKKVGLFRLEDRFVLSKVMLYITMPCLFISFFKDFTPAPTLILMFLLGIGANLVLCYTGLFFARNKSGTEKALYMLNCSGNNIGAYATPIIASIFPPAAVIATSMYDIGNSIMAAGGTYALAARYIDKERSMRWAVFFRRLFSSVPFDTYLIMLALSLLGIRLPEPVYEIAGMIGAPTIILTMIM